jgi:serine/threonine protein phosphatase PrpC
LIDGVWERHIAETLSEAVTVEDAASTLLARAVENSGLDDASIIVIEVRDP